MNSKNSERIAKILAVTGVLISIGAILGLGYIFLQVTSSEYIIRNDESETVKIRFLYTDHDSDKVFTYYSKGDVEIDSGQEYRVNLGFNNLRCVSIATDDGWNSYVTDKEATPLRKYEPRIAIYTVSEILSSSPCDMNKKRILKDGIF